MQHSRSKLPSIRNFENTRPTGSSEWSKSPPPSLNQTVPLQAYKPSPPLGLYAISKTALIGLTKLLAAELGQNLRDPTIGATLDESTLAPWGGYYSQYMSVACLSQLHTYRSRSCLRFVCGRALRNPCELPRTGTRTHALQRILVERRRLWHACQPS